MSDDTKPTWSQAWEQMRERAEAAEARVRELEAENERLEKRYGQSLDAHNREATEMADVVDGCKTAEECEYMWPAAAAKLKAEVERLRWRVDHEAGKELAARQEMERLRAEMKRLRERLAEVERLRAVVEAAHGRLSTALRTCIAKHRAQLTFLDDELRPIMARVEELQKERDDLAAEVERLRVQLAGCGVAAMTNTHLSREQQAIDSDTYGWSDSYRAVHEAVGREIAERERAEAAEAEVERLRAALEGGDDD